MSERREEQEEALAGTTHSHDGTSTVRGESFQAPRTTLVRRRGLRSRPGEPGSFSSLRRRPKPQTPLLRHPVLYKASRNPLRRTRALRGISLKRLATLPARRACVAAVIERDGGCVFWRRFTDTVIGDDGIVRDILMHWAHCDGPLDAHEPAKRSHGADPTDPSQCVCVCRRHHGWAHGHPRLAEQMGLLTRERPVSHVRVIEEAS